MYVLIFIRAYAYAITHRTHYASSTHEAGAISRARRKSRDKSMEGTAPSVGRLSAGDFFSYDLEGYLTPSLRSNLPNPGQRKLARGIVSGVCEPVMVKESVSAPTRVRRASSLPLPPRSSDASLSSSRSLFLPRPPPPPPPPPPPAPARTPIADVPRDQKLLLRSTTDVH